MEQFAKSLGADRLKAALEAAVEEHQGFYLIDGRKVFCGSTHKALNYLLQGSSAVIFKRWMVLCHKRLKEAGYEEFKVYHQLAGCHDELQFALREDQDVEKFEKIILDCIRETAEFYKMHVRLDGEAKHGSNWSDCH